MENNRISIFHVSSKYENRDELAETVISFVYDKPKHCIDWTVNDVMTDLQGNMDVCLKFNWNSSKNVLVAQNKKSGNFENYLDSCTGDHGHLYQHVMSTHLTFA